MANFHHYNQPLINIIFLLICSTAFAQYQVTIEAIIYNKETKEPIPYVNVRFTNKNIKTVSDRSGSFMLTYEEDGIEKSDSLQFKILGYRTEKVSAAQFYKFLLNTNKIYLVPEIFNDTQVETTIPRYKKENIHGHVKSNAGPLQRVVVTLKNTFYQVETDVNGNYYIEAKPNDVLVFSFIGMKSIEILVNEKEKIDVVLETDGTLLDEVELFGKSNKEDKINLGLGAEKSFEAIGYDVKIMTSKDIKPHYNNLDDLLNGKFARVVASNAKVYIPGRQGSMNYNSAAIFDVDGGIYESFPPIDLQQIETITIIKSLAGTNIYGSRGRGGVVVIRTKTILDLPNVLKQEHQVLHILPK